MAHTTPNTPTVSDLLSHDGWEHHTAYRWMLEQADNARFVMVMPDLIGDDGHCLIYHTDYADHLWSLVDARDNVRRVGFVGFAMGAHDLARRVAAARQQ